MRQRDIVSQVFFETDCLYFTFYIRKSYNIVFYNDCYLISSNNVHRIKRFVVLWSQSDELKQLLCCIQCGSMCYIKGRAMWRVS